MRLANLLCAAAAAAALFAVPACTKVVAGTAVQGTGAARPKGSACQAVSAPLTSVPPRAAGEPELRIPQPSGWQRNRMLDSAIIRFAMADPEEAARNFAPAAVVTLESEPGTTQDQQAIFDRERATLVSSMGVTNMHKRSTTLCGHPAELIDYDAPAMGRIPPRRAKTLIAIAVLGSNTYLATVTVQAANPGNPRYVRDAQSILTGFQMLPAGAG